ncbi:MAG: AbrB/MazE/SpoVT family DNA-binding domain-containing protein [Sphingomonadaceae bacterium]|nr:AbrB/MazE/SpoVT family DNA-binding domain-containing protein [Sphingomonadaceae bacterium]
MTYEAKVIAGGKIVIPAKLRREMELEVGDRLVFEREGDRVVLKSFRQVIREVQESLKKYKRPGVSEVDEFIAARRAEEAHEVARGSGSVQDE